MTYVIGKLQDTAKNAADKASEFSSLMSSINSTYNSEAQSLEELTEKYNDYLIVLGSEKYAEEMFHFLMEKRFPIEKILYSKYGMVLARRGKQYFDMFLPEDGEVFIDGGGYNGNTVSDFVEWSREEYKKVYVFEPIFVPSEVLSVCG